jgi:hypothetical protein
MYGGHAMSYDMNQEPGHRELVETCTHVDLAEYQPGAERYERLQAQLDEARRFDWPREGWEVNG